MSIQDSKSPVVAAFDELTSFETTAKINARATTFAVGQSQERDTYRLYDPTEGYRFAGTLTRDHNGLDEDDTIRFHPSDDDGDPITIYNLNVNADERTELLDEYLTEIRNNLTSDSVDYSEERPRGGFQDELDGFNALADFATTDFDGQLQLVVQHLSKAEVSKALFAHNNGATDTLSLIDIGVTRRSSNDDETSPFAIRELLIEYQRHTAESSE